MCKIRWACREPLGLELGAERLGAERPPGRTSRTRDIPGQHKVTYRTCLLCLSESNGGQAQGAGRSSHQDGILGPLVALWVVVWLLFPINPGA